MMWIGDLLRARLFLWLVLLIPALVISWRYAAGTMFYGEVIHASGEWSIRLMMLAMAATPVTLALPGKALSRWLMKNRRYFGVASFVYAVLHAVVYLDKTALLADIVDEAIAPGYLTGWIALLIFAVLAATSNDASVRWLKRTWKRVHRAVYAAALLSFAHWVLVAFNPIPALLHVGVLAGLEAYRVWKLAAIRAVAP